MPDFDFSTLLPPKHPKKPIIETPILILPKVQPQSIEKKRKLPKLDNVRADYERITGTSAQHGTKTLEEMAFIVAEALTNPGSMAKYYGSMSRDFQMYQEFYQEQNTRRGDLHA